MKKLNLILRKCKSLSKQLGRSSSYSSLRSKSNREEGDELWRHISTGDDAVVLVGSSRRRYMISSKYLNHPLFNALIEKSSMSGDNTFAVKCEVVLFDHLLWMLDNADIDCGSLEELAELYVF
ncbi:Small auxin-up RNA protein [Dioscorea alata]|uniref:Auxin-responsive protein SAUR78 n=2 Tax=Dioscorea TaxID=4672 RepID=A0AB40CKT4_DIOCR|nr:auxin-responsive protein SAUR78 [Dioscorea cayenensis subsp. rotundata]KAH7661146.1 Small auxin-up RNA protein [Dioscorea alata]